MEESRLIEAETLPNERCCVHESLVVAGGWNEKEDMESVEFYQGAINEWKLSWKLRQPRSCCALVAFEQYLYVLGGVSYDKVLSSVERTGTLKMPWQVIQSMQIPRKWFSAVNCSGIVYAIGGTTNEGITTSAVEKYDAGED